MIAEDLDTLIESKRREIDEEKIMLGLAPPPSIPQDDENKENNESASNKKVNFKEPTTSFDHEKEDKKNYRKTLYELDETIPPELERYIRRYCGLPVMLKAGEYSPNNPLLRLERASAGDALLGLGEYERRRNTLRKIRQAQYRQYLDQQAKKKQEAKQQAERERREREEKEREREERERQLLLEREKYSPERRASVCSVPVGTVGTTRVDTAVQVDGVNRPLSVAVQTDDAEIYRLSPPLYKLTLAERELSPRAVENPPWGEYCQDTGKIYSQSNEIINANKQRTKSNREKLVSDLRHTYVPSIFDADAIQERNAQAEKEAAARRQFYQQELKNQILEQQRIREERKSREKMLEQAEMRRLEDQLRMLRAAQDREIDKQHLIDASMKNNASEFEIKRTELQKEIDMEQKKLLRPLATSRTIQNTNRFAPTSKSDTNTRLPPFYPQNEKTFQPIDKNRKPYSFNIPDNSVFSDNYDVDSYLRKNLNFRDQIDKEIGKIGNHSNTNAINKENVIVEKAVIHEHKDKHEHFDNISIPVLRHSPKSNHNTDENNTKLSDAMKKIDDKWKVPAVQKNILKTLPSEDGKNISILTQLGSIRRQLQLEQFKLDKMMSKDD